MKTLAVTFISALAIICIAITYDKSAAANDSGRDFLVGKTIVTHDSQGRPISELTLTARGNAWEETMMKRTSYDGPAIESVVYTKTNDGWKASTRQTYVNTGGVLVCTSISRMASDGEWDVQIARDVEDLSDGDDHLDDMEFDSRGNLVMKATYVYNGDSRVGLQKEEYFYDGGKMSQTTSYSWDGGSWQKQMVSNLVEE